ncbi:phospholipase A and acyltransferase 3-like [Sander lucioperca]|uniref:phospholipase A and acyltransferase 3-like n=1 Tax=Sander lucioperca TaxID=283035 RepID=UPI0016539F94|nr:phospholipase A and acyltransferase 3-like [Sander lucioperca]XP_035862284.1 phospholipase A and acyltransferase 3-like [Sander lucioperca]
MKNLILVALILLLGITPTESSGEFQFGDIIAFERTFELETIVYKHYAFYVGPSTEIDVGQGDNDIIHLTGKTCMVSEIAFGKIEKVKGTSTVLKDNYLDEVEGFKIQNNKATEDLMIQRIKDTIKQRSMYRPFKNNCELYVTRLRYGKPSFEQHGTLVEPFLKKKEAATKALKTVAKYIVTKLG